MSFGLYSFSGLHLRRNELSDQGGQDKGPPPRVESLLQVKELLRKDVSAREFLSLVGVLGAAAALALRTRELPDNEELVNISKSRILIR